MAGDAGMELIEKRKSMMTGLSGLRRPDGPTGKRRAIKQVY